jgi:hypothetical protein
MYLRNRRPDKIQRYEKTFITGNLLDAATDL